MQRADCGYGWRRYADHIVRRPAPCVPLPLPYSPLQWRAALFPTFVVVAVLLAACSSAADPAGEEAAAAGEAAPQQAAGSRAVAANDDLRQASEGAEATEGEDASSGELSTAGEAIAGELEFEALVAPTSVPQGQAFIVAVAGSAIGAASVVQEGQFISLQGDSGGFSVVLGVALNEAPGPKTLTLAVFPAANGEPVLQELQFEVIAGEFVSTTLELSTELERLLDPQVAAEGQRVRDAVQLGKSPARLWSGTFQVPTAGAISSLFGEERSYTNVNASSVHTGLDFVGALGDPVVAAHVGVVSWTGETERRGRGVIVDHGGGVFTAYWHLGVVDVEEGQQVLQGAPIARVGNSGLSTGPHLHFEVVVHGTAVDPLPWLRDLEVPNPSAAVVTAAATLAAKGGPAAEDAETTSAAGG